MLEDLPLPQNCESWKIGQSTPYPPEDELFLRMLAEAGFSTFKGSGGMVGARHEGRDVFAIHCGKGKRWHLSLAENNADQFESHVLHLPSKTAVAGEWLNGGSLESIRAVITKNEW